MTGTSIRYLSLNANSLLLISFNATCTSDKTDAASVRGIVRLARAAWAMARRQDERGEDGMSNDDDLVITIKSYDPRGNG